MPKAIVTGAFSNTGSAVASELLRRGWQVETLTNRTAPENSPIKAHPLRFDVTELAEVLDGADALINTYWVRFPYRNVTFKSAVENSLLLFDVAQQVGVKRVVQVSVSNAHTESGLAYYDGKAQVDVALKSSGLSYAIVRPTLIVGPNDVLTNNIAWFIRRFPFFALPASGGYRMQPITLNDVGRVIADAAESSECLDLDAAGPDIFTFAEYVQMLAHALGKRRRFIKLPPRMIISLLALVNPFLRDTVLTYEELEGLRCDMLVSHTAPLGTESVSDWLQVHGAQFGCCYTNDTLERFAPSSAQQ